jgi:hypothetical protein
VEKFRERLAVNKPRLQRFHMERFNLKKLNRIEGKRSNVLRSQLGLQLSETWMQRWILILLVKLLHRI